MLIDEILSNPLVAKSGLLSTDLRGRLSKATKFVLRRDFAIAADEFSSDIGNVDKVLGLARLPFPECWFEVAQEDRKLFATSPVPLDPGEAKLARVGFLCTQCEPQGSWTAQLFWSFAAGVTFGGIHLMPLVSGHMLVVDPHKDSAIAASWFCEAPSTLGPLTSMSDWIGEPGFLIATLALLNSRNACETLPGTPNNKRCKLTGKPLLFDYHWVCIPQRYKHRHLPSDDADPLQLRAHFVRGHFKARKTGIFFWSAYQRGNPKLGFVHKDYVLAQPGAAA